MKQRPGRSARLSRWLNDIYDRLFTLAERAQRHARYLWLEWSDPPEPRAVLWRGRFLRPACEELETRVLLSSVSFSAPTYLDPGTLDPATVTVQLDAPAAQTITVDYATSDGSALAGTDYAAANGTLTFAPGDTTQTIDLAILPNAATNPRAFNVTLSNPLNASLGATAAATVTLDPPVVQFSAVNYAAYDSAGSVTIDVMLSVASPQAITVGYMASPWTAIPGTDFTPVAGTLTINPGVTDATFSIPVLNDGGFDGDQTVSLALTDASNAIIGDGGNALLTLQDYPTATFSAPTYDAVENTGNAPVTITLSVPSTEPVTVAYATSDGTAVGGTDYTPTGGLLTFNPGETSKTIDVPLLLDGVSDGDETVNLTLADPSNAVIGATGTAVLTIQDQPTVTFAAASFNAFDTEPAATVTVTLSAPSSQPVTVDYASANGTATAGTDYTAVSGTLSFDPFATTTTFTVPLLGDGAADGSDTVNLALSNPSQASLGSAAATLNLLDPPTVQFSAPAYSAFDTDGAATITVSLSTPSTQTVTVTYAATAGSAIDGTDFTSVSDTLTFAPGETSTTFTVPVVNDGANDGSETVNLTLTSATNATIGAAGTAVLTLEDYPTIEFSAAAYSAYEPDGTATITVNLLQPSALPVSVDCYTTDGTAAANTDYVAESDTLTFAPGQTTQTFTITLLDDGTQDGDQTVNIALSRASNAVIGATSAAVLTIHDYPAIDFSAPSYTVLDSAGSAVLTVNLAAASALAVTVNYATGGGTAIAGTDYTATSGTLTFAPGQTSKTITVPVLGDATADDDETVNVTLSSPTNGVIDGSGTAIVTMQDSPVIDFSATSFSAATSDANAVVTIALSAPSPLAVSVDYATADDTAVAGTDYVAQSGTLTFNAGQTSQTINVALLPGAQPGHRFGINLSNPSHGRLPSAPLGPVVLTNPLPTVQFSAYSYSTPDAYGNAVITVTVSPAAPQAVTVEYGTVAGGTAMAGTDYLPITVSALNTLTFSAGQTSQTFTVPTLFDARNTTGLTVDLQLAAPTGALLGSPASAVLNIVPPAPPPLPTVQFATNAYSAPDAAGPSSAITVTVTPLPSQPVTVYYTAAPGSAVLGTDYNSTGGSFTIGINQGNGTFTIPILYDGASTSAKTVNLQLSSANGATIYAVPLPEMLAEIAA